METRNGNRNAKTSSALAVGKEGMGQDAVALVQLLGNIQRKFLVDKLLLAA